MIFQSIRWRLQVWYGLVFLAVLAGFGVTAYALLRNVQLRNLDEAFLKRMAPLSNSLRPPPGGPGPNGPRMGRGGRRGDRGDRGDPGDRGGRGGGFPNDGPPEERMFAGPGTPGFQFHLPSEQAALFGSESNSFYYVVWEIGRAHV